MFQANTTRLYSVHSKPGPATDQQHQRRLTISDLYDKYNKKEPLSMLTAVDYHSGSTVDQAGVDMILVGDSLGMTALGYDSTVPVTMPDMIHHCKAVARGSTRSFLIGDMPFGSYEFNEDAVRNAIQFVKEGSMQAVKLEGTDKTNQIKSIVSAGVPVIGHIGLTPQAINQLGSYKVVGKTPKEAIKLWEAAHAIQEAGAGMLVLECVPQRIAQTITDSLQIPTIGIGSGYCSGQVLVYHDLLGMYQHFTPKFCKQYLSLNEPMREACQRYSIDVKTKQFPVIGKNTFVIGEQAYQSFLNTIEPESSSPKSTRTDGIHKQQSNSSQANLSPIGNIVVVGSGAVGMMISAALVESRGKNSNVILVPGRSESRISKEGIITELPNGEKRIAEVNVVDSLDQLPRTIDLMIVTVKNYATSSALSKIVQETGTNVRRVLSLQNGSGNCDTIHQVFKHYGQSPEVYQASLYSGSTKLSSNTIRVTNEKIDIRIPTMLKNTPIAQIFSDIQKEHRFEVNYTQGDQVDWKKMVVNSVINPITAVFGVTNGMIAQNHHLKSVATQLVEECMTIIQLTPGAREQFDPAELTNESMLKVVLDTAMKTANNESSMLSDIKSGQGSTEIDSLSSVFVDRAAQLRIPLPVNEMMIQMVKFKTDQKSM